MQNGSSLQLITRDIQNKRRVEHKAKWIGSIFRDFFLPDIIFNFATQRKYEF